MQIVRDTSACPDLPAGTAVTIGAYDGVHLGHRVVIDKVRAIAADRGVASAVVTFDRHPASIVRPESAPKLLCDLEQKLELLESTGVDLTVVIRFDEERASETAENFVQSILVDCLNAKAIVVGADFHFGKNRGGNVALLEKLGPAAGFDVLGIDLVDAEGSSASKRERVSSTAIRKALTAGDLSTANALLGRHHTVNGVVEHGDKRGGAELGFPTANVAVPDRILLPADGIYAGLFAREDGTRLPTAISLGRRPTFYETADTSLLEAYILDFSGDLYGESAAVSFVEFLRGEAKFDSVDALVEQMNRDVDHARRVLKTYL